MPHYVKHPHSPTHTQKHKKPPPTHPQTCPHEVLSQYHAVRPSYGHFRSLPHYVLHTHTHSKTPNTHPQTSPHEVCHNMMPLDQATAISAHYRITEKTHIHPPTHTVAWSNSIVLWQNILWACLWVCVRHFLTFLGMFGCVWVCLVVLRNAAVSGNGCSLV